jgi:hypothetical protein
MGRFSNDPAKFGQNMDRLPEELVREIYYYVPQSITTFLTKKSYLKDHHLVIKWISKGNIENYIRAMIRQDNDFVFKQLLVENRKRWFEMTKWYHKNYIYSNYITFLEMYALDNESKKCRNLITELFEEQGLSKNQHKKNVIKYIRWKT